MCQGWGDLLRVAQAAEVHQQLVFGAALEVVVLRVEALVHAQEVRELRLQPGKELDAARRLEAERLRLDVDRPGSQRGLEERRELGLAVVDSGHHRHAVDGHRDARFGEALDGAQAPSCRSRRCAPCRAPPGRAFSPARGRGW